MTLQLTQERIDILSAYVSAGDRSSYYSTLSDWGDNYAALALEVVDHTPISGTMANAFMAETAIRHGRIIDEESAISISLQLMALDFDERKAAFEQGNTGSLSSRVIQDYHAAAFEDHYLDISCWTAYEPMRIAEEHWVELFNVLRPLGLVDHIPDDPVSEQTHARSVMWDMLTSGLIADIVRGTVHTAIGGVSR